MDKINETGSQEVKKGIKRGGTFAFIAAILCLVCSLLLAVETMRIEKNQSALAELYDEYNNYVTVSQLLRLGSDELSEQVRLYAVTGDLQYMNAYFQEANVTRSRDRALQMLREHDDPFEALPHLAEALQYSVDLMRIEFKSMKLVSQAYGRGADGIPYEEVRDAALTPEEEAMTAAEKREYGLFLLFDEVYENEKGKIWDKTDSVLQSAIIHTDELLTDISAAQENSIARQRIYLILFIASVIALGSIIIARTKTDIIREEKLEDVEMLSEHLSEELAEATVRANEDPLTGLYNRAAYKARIEALQKDGKRDFAILAWDINDLKRVNDNYGHDVGDIYIRNCCDVFCEIFNKKSVYRTGGDEFAVVLVGDDFERRDELMEKLKAAETSAEKIPTFDAGKAGFAYGLAVFRRSGGKTAEEVQKQADELMYEKKREMKNK
ncbi:MAG: GGDEF domain-containing protein [Clostridia bacterium]|nr:GGDEF domain-containing protein [Clostridia bacterium]